MKTVKAYCVKGKHPDDYYLWTCSILRLGAQRTFVDVAMIKGGWPSAKKNGFKVVQVEIREIPDD